MNRIHTYNNGIKCHSHSISQGALERYRKYINLHEPFEDTVFEHIIKNCDIKTFIDVGSAWGYYSILAKKLNKEINVIGFDRPPSPAPHDFCPPALERSWGRIEDAYENAKLNDITDIEFRDGRIPDDFKLSDVIDEVGQIDLIKIDIQGTGASALKSAGSDIIRIKNVILGTHNEEHAICLDLLKEHGFEIKLDLTANQIPIQPDGLLWAVCKRNTNNSKNKDD